MLQRLLLSEGRDDFYSTLHSGARFTTVTMLWGLGEGESSATEYAKNYNKSQWQKSGHAASSECSVHLTVNPCHVLLHSPPDAEGVIKQILEVHAY